MHDAIVCERRVKEWKRVWKIELIEKTNPHWLDLYAECCGPDIDV